jgi:membrane fusion protein (multidrug efflux system)
MSKTLHLFRGGQRTRAIITAAGLAFAAAAAPAVQAQDAPPPKVSVMAAVMKPVQLSETFIGRGEAKDKVDVIARVGGYLEEVLVGDGTEVQAGDLMFRIESSSYEAVLEARRAELAQAEANLELAALDLERKQELFERGSVPEAERDTARANELVAEAQVRSARAAIQQAELDLSYTEVHAPFSGRVGRVGVSIGDVVGPTSKPLVNIVREAPIYVSFALNEKDFIEVLEQVDRDSRNRPKPDSIPEVFVILPSGTQLEEKGRVAFVDNRVDQATGSVILRAEFENVEKLIIDGSFLTVGLQEREPEDQLFISQAAIQRDQQGPFVLVVNEDQTVEQRYIVTGETFGVGMIIRDGLTEGEQVIVEGLQRVRPGAIVDPVLANQAGEE